MKEQFTPGPWALENIGEKENCWAVGTAHRISDEQQVGGIIDSFDDDMNLVYDVAGICFVEDSCHRADGMLHADAHLIATAPVLYASLKSLASMIEIIEDNNGTMRPEIVARPDISLPAFNAARAALAKARGE